MKNLIRKILKEEQDEFEWARGFDTSEAEKTVKKPFIQIERNFNFDSLRIYDMIVDAGIRDINKLMEIGDELYNEVDRVYEDARESGYESGRDDCTCDGCCDDYVYYQDADREKEEAREEGREEGRESAQEEIQELKDRIEELESQLNESINQKNTKRI
jgi:hypothetical protein